MFKNKFLNLTLFTLALTSKMSLADDFQTGVDVESQNGTTLLKPKMTTSFFHEVRSFTPKAISIYGETGYAEDGSVYGAELLRQPPLGGEFFQTSRENIVPVLSKTGYIHSSDLSPDGQYLLLGTSGGERRVGPDRNTRVDNGTELLIKPVNSLTMTYRLTFPNQKAFGITRSLFTPDGSKVVFILGRAGGMSESEANQRVLVYDISVLSKANQQQKIAEAGEPLISWDIGDGFHTLNYMSLDFSPDGKLLVSKDFGRFDVLNLETKEHLYLKKIDSSKIIQDSKNFRSATGCLQDRLLSYINFAAPEDRYIHTFDYSGKEIAPVKKVTVSANFQTSIFTRDGKYLVGFLDPVSGSDPKVVQVIRVADGKVYEGQWDLDFKIADVLLVNGYRTVELKEYSAASSSYKAAFVGVDDIVAALVKD